MDYKEAIKKGEEYLDALNELIDSGQIPIGDINDNIISSFNIIEGHVDQIRITLEKTFIPKPTKKSNLVTAEFSLKGRVDLIENERINLELFGWKLSPKTDTDAIYNSITYLLSEINTEPEDILILEVECDPSKDVLNINIAFQTDDPQAKQKFDRKDFAIYTNARKQTFGYSCLNKAYFKNENIKVIPSQIWEYPCYGVSLPYSLELRSLEDVNFLLTQISQAVQPNGELADLRAFAKGYRLGVDNLVTQLKGLKWKSILTQWERHYLNTDGITYRTIKIW